MTVKISWITFTQKFKRTKNPALLLLLHVTLPDEDHDDQCNQLWLNSDWGHFCVDWRVQILYLHVTLKIWWMDGWISIRLAYLHYTFWLFGKRSSWFVFKKTSLQTIHLFCPHWPLLITYSIFPVSFKRVRLLLAFGYYFSKPGDSTRPIAGKAN